jgi:hypothetical protein
LLFFFKGRSPNFLIAPLSAFDQRQLSPIRDRGSTFSSHLGDKAGVIGEGGTKSWEGNASTQQQSV